VVFGVVILLGSHMQVLMAQLYLNSN